MDEKWVDVLLQDYGEFKAGFLLRDPPVIDHQPARWLDFMREIGAVFGGYMKEISSGK